EQGTQTGDDPIRSAQLGRTFASAIQDQELMPNQHGFGHHTAEPARLCQSHHNADQMNEYDEEVTHPGNGIKASKPPDCAIFCNSPWTGGRNNGEQKALDRSAVRAPRPLPAEAGTRASALFPAPLLR